MTASLDSKHVIGCDIGGANLKLADNRGRSAACNFPMWLKPTELAAQLREMLAEFPVTEATYFAITMTGELADCFATRREGVRAILLQTEQVFAPERTRVYAVGNRWCTPFEAVAKPWDVAASNWHALATWIGMTSTTATDLVLDVGSTTVDIIPMRRHSLGISRPATEAKTDRDRLELAQLVYTGIERTPVAAILRFVVLHGQPCALMAERFATSDDCYVILGLTPESPQDWDSADNRPRTRANAHARLARMIGEDAETLSFEDATEIARQFIDEQASLIAIGLEINLLPSPSSSARITVAGHGRALAERAIARLSHRSLEVTWLADEISPATARCAPAVAVAELLALKSRE